MIKNVVSVNYESTASKLLDLFRGVAAILVVLNHFRSLFFINFQDVENPTVFHKAFYLMTSLGHESVMVFFVLSGYFISSSVIRSINSNKWEWRTYFVNRFTRLYIVLFPALLLGLFWDSLGIHILQATSLYNGNLNESILSFSTIDRLDISTFIGNALFLQEIQTYTFGSNGALWSLSYEFWYYIIFPCLALLVLKKKWYYALMSLSLFVFIGVEASIYFIVWIMGFLVAIIPSVKLISPILKTCLLILSLGLFSMAVVLSSLQMLPVSEIVIGICFSILIYLIISVLNQKPAVKYKISQIPSFLANFSYTLYLVHIPFIVFIYALFLNFGFSKWEVNIYTLASALFIIIITLIYGWLISRFTEAKTGHLKRFVNEKVFNLQKPYKA